jgi:hypothetical protein
MQAYVITVKALGYETHTLTVDAVSLREAEKSQKEAISQWCELNEVETSESDLAFVTCRKK